MPIAQQQWLPLSDELSLESVYKHTPEDVDYVFKIADCTDELLQAYSLLYKEYLNAGYVQEDPHELLFTPHHLLPQTKVFIAKSAATVLSTATLVHDSRQFGLPMDALYLSELDALRGQGRKILEVCSLASNSCDFPKYGIQNFTRLIFLYCLYLDIDDVCIMVHPRHAHLYKNRYEFKMFGEERHYPRVNAPAVALRANIHDVRQKFGRLLFKFSYKYKLFSRYLSLKIALSANICEVFSACQSFGTHPNPLDADQVNRITANGGSSLPKLPRDFAELLQAS